MSEILESLRRTNDQSLFCNYNSFFQKLLQRISKKKKNFSSIQAKFQRFWQELPIKIIFPTFMCITTTNQELPLMDKPPAFETIPYLPSQEPTQQFYL